MGAGGTTGGLVAHMTCGVSGRVVDFKVVALAPPSSIETSPRKSSFRGTPKYVIPCDARQWEHKAKALS